MDLQMAGSEILTLKGEMGGAEGIFRASRHPYARCLLGAI
jgi:hypothetical protein